VGPWAQQQEPSAHCNTGEATGSVALRRAHRTWQLPLALERMVWFVPLFLYGGSAGEAGVLPALGLRWVVAVKAELFRFELSNFSCLQLL